MVIKFNYPGKTDNSDCTSGELAENTINRCIASCATATVNHRHFGMEDPITSRPQLMRRLTCDEMDKVDDDLLEGMAGIICGRCNDKNDAEPGSWSVIDPKLEFGSDTITITCSEGHTQIAEGPFEPLDCHQSTSFRETILSKKWPCWVEECKGKKRPMTVDPVTESSSQN